MVRRAADDNAEVLARTKLGPEEFGDVARRRAVRVDSVPDNDVEPTKFRFLGVRFVSCIDDRTIDHSIKIVHAFEKVGALGQLIRGCVCSIFSSDFSCATKYWS